MLTVRPANERGKADFGWLKSQHSFSFGSYFDPRHVSFGPLRVINEDQVIPSAGFDTHGHRDMEIISYVLDGALEHKDSTGTGSVIRPGDIQRMSAGSGILHSEYNHSKEDPVHFLQIWIQPDTQGIEPGYEQKRIDPAAVRNRLGLVAGPDGGEGAVTLHQDAKLYVARLEDGREVAHSLSAGRGVWVQVARGRVEVNGCTLQQGDGAAVQDVDAVSLRAETNCEVLLFDLPVSN